MAGDEVGVAAAVAPVGTPVGVGVAVFSGGRVRVGSGGVAVGEKAAVSARSGVGKAKGVGEAAPGSVQESSVAARINSGSSLGRMRPAIVHRTFFWGKQAATRTVRMAH